MARDRLSNLDGLGESPSFRVYTQAELRNVALRPSYRVTPEQGLAEELKTSFHEGVEAIRANPHRTGKWAAIVVGGMFALLGILVWIANATDDTVSSRRDRITTARRPPPASVEPTPAEPSPPPTEPAVAPAPDFGRAVEGAPRTAAKPRRAWTKHGKRQPAGPPSVTLRTPPF